MNDRRAGTGASPGSAEAWLSHAQVHPSVLELRPDYRALLVVVDGLRPGPSDAVSDALLTDAEQSARTRLAGRRVEDLEQVAQWRQAYRAFGAKPQRTRPSVEALLRSVEEGLPRVDRITDTYNAISVDHLLPIGGEDRARYTGPARLVRAAGDETFDTSSAGEPTVEHPMPGEVVWRDDEGVTCRRWNWRQCTRTRIGHDTTSAVFILDGLAAVGDDDLFAAGRELTEALGRLSPTATSSTRLLAASALPDGRRVHGAEGRR